MLQAAYTKYLLHFKLPAGTSRGKLYEKETWFIKVWEEENPHIFGLGECALFRGLSSDDHPEYESNLKECCININDSDFLSKKLFDWPSIKFGYETALLDFKNGGKHSLFPSAFTQGKAGIPINGLIWMGTNDFIKQQVKEKINAGFKCLKFKVGALNISDELDLLKLVRTAYSHNDLEIRLDANGAFPFSTVFETLEKFYKFHIHSIEQPIKAGNVENMAKVCKNSPIPVALDEELIGLKTLDKKKKLLENILPHYIILKPSLLGGFSSAKDWINEAEKLNISWWITSALESNLGLNSIAQWTYTLSSPMTQGLGTGSLYTNNIPSPLYTNGQQLFFNPDNNWDISNIQFNDGNVYH